jgi:hypothetical protein
LNILPKTAFATESSYRTGRANQQQLLAGWITALAARLFPEGRDFALDFHAIPYRGDPTALENHYLPKQGKAGPSVLSFFAQELPFTIDTLDISAQCVRAPEHQPAPEHGLPSHGLLAVIHPAQDDPQAPVVDGSTSIRSSGLPGPTRPYT